MARLKGKMIPAHSCFTSLYTFILIIMKLHTKTPHESRMCPSDSWVQRSRSKCIDNRNWFLLHNCLPFTHIGIIMKLKFLYTRTPKDLKELRMCHIDFGVQRSRSQCIDDRNWFMLHTCLGYLLHLLSCNFIQRLPMSQGCALLISR